MARGNEIIVTAEPKGMFHRGFVAAGQTPKPGTWMQVDPTVAIKGGRHTWKIYDRAASGDRPAGPLAVLINDYLLGRTMTDAVAAGDFVSLYTPAAGEELNCLYKFGDTSDTHTAGELAKIEDATGKLIAGAGTPQSSPFVLLETATLTADTHLWVKFGGF